MGKVGKIEEKNWVAAVTPMNSFIELCALNNGFPYKKWAISYLCSGFWMVVVFGNVGVMDIKWWKYNVISLFQRKKTNCTQSSTTRLNEMNKNEN